MLARVLCDSGHLRHAPPVLCSALDDIEDGPPFQRSTMHDQDDDSRSAPTMAPDAVRDTEESGPPTAPPGPDDLAADIYERSMPPNANVPAEAKDLGLVEQLGAAPKTLEDSYLDRAIRVVASAGARLAADREERRQEHAAVLAAILRSDTNQSANHALLRDAIDKLKKSDASQDGKIADLRTELAALREQAAAAHKIFDERICELEKRIVNAPAAPASPAPEGA